MPEDTSNPFAAMIGALASKGGEKGVRKDTDGKVNPHLTPTEVSRYEKIFGIMKKVVNPGPETGQLDTRAAGRIGGTAAMQQAAASASGGGGGNIGFGVAGMTALAAAGLATFWEEIKLGMQDFFGETLPNVGVAVGKGMLGAAKVLGKIGLAVFPTIGKLVGKPLLRAMRFLPFIGTIASFALAYMDYNAKDYEGMGLNILSGLINLIPVVGNVASMALDGFIIWREFQQAKQEDSSVSEDDIKQGQQPLKQAGSMIWGILSSKMRYLPILGGLFRWGLAYQEFESDNWLSGIKNLALGFLSFKFGDLAGEAVDSVLFGKGVATYEWMEQNKGNAPDDFDKHNSKGIENLNKHLSSNKVSFFESLGMGMGKLIDAFFADLKNPKTGGLLGLQDPFAEETSELDKVVKQSIWGARDKVIAGLSNSKLVKDNPFLNPVESIENLLVGSVLSHKSRDAGSKEQRLKAKKEMSKRMIFGSDYTSLEERFGLTPKVNDGIILQNGMATRIDDKDSLLAAKSGGPIDKMLDQNSEVMKSLRSINAQQLNVLIEIRDGILSLSRPPSEPSFNNAPLTQEFFS